MASAKDPIKTVEGMYKGSLARLSYFFKSPSAYGDLSLLVLKETAKRYDDALDDCVIQIQRAKWLLEYELAQNQARRVREAAAKDTTSNKRKVDQISAEPAANTPSIQQEENPNKKTKLQVNAANVSPITDKAVRPEHFSPVVSKTEKKPPPTASQQTSQPVPHRGPTPALMPVSKPDLQPDLQPDLKPDLQPVPQPTLPKSHPKKPDTPLTPKTTPQTTPQKGILQGGQGAEATGTVKDTAKKAAQPPAPSPSGGQQTKEDKAATIAKEAWQEEEFQPGEFDLESFFPNDGIVNDQPTNDFNLESGPGPQVGFSAPEESNLELLPGLESYANATGDDLNMLDPLATGAQSGNPAPASNAFDNLPDMPEDGNFADLLQDTALGDDSFLDGSWEDEEFFKM